MKNNNLETPEAGKTSGMRGLTVVSSKEGKLLGKVTHVFISQANKKISGIASKDEFWDRTRLHFPVSEIESIGKDVIIIKSEKSGVAFTDPETLTDLSIHDLQGRWVTTEDGRHLGQFLDVNFDPASWAISELLMADNKMLKVNSAETSFGVDEIIVPSSCFSKLEKQKDRKAGLMSRILGEENTEQISRSLSRATFSRKHENKTFLNSNMPEKKDEGVVAVENR